jgi:hypothetical protein
MLKVLRCLDSDVMAAEPSRLLTAARQSASEPSASLRISMNGPGCRALELEEDHRVA